VWNFITANRPPRFILSARDTTINEGQLLRFTVVASDSDNDPLTFTGINFPTGATLDSIDPTSRVFNWMPSYMQAGVYSNIEVAVSDGYLSDTTRFAITVRNVNRAPMRFALIYPNGRDSIKLTYPSVPVIFLWRKSIDPDEGDIVIYSLRLSGSGLDTTFVGIQDTTISLSIMSRLKRSSIYQWYVTATDGQLTSSSDSSAFRTSSMIVSAPKNSMETPATVFTIEQNYPNPFNPGTEIVFTVPRQSHVKIAIYNILGHLVCELANADYAPGVYCVQWNGTSSEGVPVSSGVYFYQMITDAGVITKRMILLR